MARKSKSKTKKLKPVKIPDQSELDLDKAAYGGYVLCDSIDVDLIPKRKRSDTPIPTEEEEIESMTVHKDLGEEEISDQQRHEYAMLSKCVSLPPLPEKVPLLPTPEGILPFKIPKKATGARHALGLKTRWWVQLADGRKEPYHSIRDMTHRLREAGYGVPSVEAMRAFARRRRKGCKPKPTTFAPFKGLKRIWCEGKEDTDLLAARGEEPEEEEEEAEEMEEQEQEVAPVDTPIAYVTPVDPRWMQGLLR